MATRRPAQARVRPSGATERAGGSPLGEATANGGAPEGRGDSEVPEISRRRTFTVAYKERILSEIDSCQPRSGQVGAILRREGLYASSVQAWRRARDHGGKDALKAKKRGPAPNPDSKNCDRLERENARLREQLERARLIIDIQKKVSQLLGIPLNSEPNGEKK